MGFLDYQIPTPGGIHALTRTNKKLNLKTGGSERDRVVYYQNQIRVWEEMRARAEPRWAAAVAAFNNSPKKTADDAWIFGDMRDQMIRAGLPYAATMTTVAALTSRYPNFVTRPKKAGSRELAKLARLILKNEWNCDERQWLIQKAVMMLRHTGLVIGKIEAARDFDEWEKEQEEEFERSQELAGISSEDAAIMEMVDTLAESAIAESEEDYGYELTAEVNHQIRKNEIGVILVSPYDYYADPDCSNLTYGVRWEAIRRRMLLCDLQDNPRYEKSVTKRLKPNVRSRYKYPLGTATMMPESHQLIDVYEVYDYFHPKYKHVGGAMLTVCPGCEDYLEIRENPYGCRPFSVQEYNVDLTKPDDEGVIFPQTDFDSWKEAWYGFQDILHRAMRQLQKAPYSTICVDTEASASPDEIEAALDNSGPGVVRLALDGKPINAVLQELRTAQVSPEYINFLRFLLEIIRLAEGLGPNQFGGAPLKSETSGTEAAEIGNSSRLRLDVKEYAITRWQNDMAKKFVDMKFRFNDFDEIVQSVGEEAAQIGLDIEAARAGDILDVSVQIEAHSMSPEGPQQKLAKLTQLYGLLMQDPLLAQQTNRDAVLNLCNDIFSDLDTGEDMFVPLDDPRAMLNMLRSMMAQGGGGPAKGKPSPPKSQPASAGVA